MIPSKAKNIVKQCISMFPAWLGTHYVNQVALKLTRHIPVSDSHVLALKVMSIFNNRT